MAILSAKKFFFLFSKHTTYITKYKKKTQSEIERQKKRDREWEKIKWIQNRQGKMFYGTRRINTEIYSVFVKILPNLENTYTIFLLFSITDNLLEKSTRITRMLGEEKKQNSIILLQISPHAVA